MAQLISVRIDLDKITESRKYKGEKGTYIDLTVAVNDEPNKYGKTVSVYEEQKKEERESKTPKNYLGEGKVIWSSAGGTVNSATTQKPTTQPAPAASSGDDQDLPF